MIIKGWNGWCSLLPFCLLSLVQTSQWIRIYCCFVFWEKTVAWEKIPKSSVGAPPPARLTSQTCCRRWAFHLWGCQTRSLPAAQKRASRLFLKAEWTVKLLWALLVWFRDAIRQLRQARSNHKDHIWHHKKNKLRWKSSIYAYKMIEARVLNGAKLNSLVTPQKEITQFKGMVIYLSVLLWYFRRKALWSWVML